MYDPPRVPARIFSPLLSTQYLSLVLLTIVVVDFHRAPLYELCPSSLHTIQFSSLLQIALQQVNQDFHAHLTGLSAMGRLAFRSVHRHSPTQHILIGQRRFGFCDVFCQRLQLVFFPIKTRSCSWLCHPHDHCTKQVSDSLMFAMNCVQLPASIGWIVLHVPVLHNIYPRFYEES